MASSSSSVRWPGIFDSRLLGTSVCLTMLATYVQQLRLGLSYTHRTLKFGFYNPSSSLLPEGEGIDAKF